MTYEAAPLFEDVAEAPEGGKANWCVAADGVKIRAAHWATGEDRGTIFVFPGRTEYIEKYGRTVYELREAGYAALVVDWRGQGLAQRVCKDPAVGHIRHFSDYQLDVMALIAYARSQNLPKPWFLLAHSMGGCIGLRTIIAAAPFNAVAFSAPMWRIQMSQSSAIMAPFAAKISTLLGRHESIAPTQSRVTMIAKRHFAGNDLTNDPEMFAYLRRQHDAHPELTLGGPSIGWYLEADRENEAIDHLPSPDLPAIAFLGSDERIVDPERIKSRMSRWPNGELVLLPNGRHELLIELPHIREMVLQRSLALFSANA